MRSQGVLLDFHVLERSLDDEVAVGADVLFEAGGDGGHAAVDFRLVQLAFSDQLGVALGDLVLAAVSPLLLDVAQGDGVTLDLRKSLRDALAHGASADNAYFHSCNLLVV